MKITSDLFTAFLKCPTKCYLRSLGEPGTGNEYADWVRARAESYRAAGVDRLRRDTPQDHLTAPSADELKQAKWRLAVDVLAGTEALGTRIHALERVPPVGQSKAAQFVPIRFVPNNKLEREEKLLLGFDALALSGTLGRRIDFGRIVHGDEQATMRVKTDALVGEVQKLTEKAVALVSSTSPPDLVLNRHCGECEFQARCRQKATEKDDLSLLSNLKEKERKKFNSEGIFTVTQLSYTFRPRRRPKRLRDKPEKHHHALKALAIRERKIHVVGTPELKIDGTPVYLDVEGLPDRDFYYLIGLRVKTAETVVQHSLWADDFEGEKKAWSDFLAVLATIEKPVLLHYGRFEAVFLRRMSERYGGPADGSPIAKAFASATNVLSVIFSQIYFPTYSNGLKDVGAWLGCRWSSAKASGVRSILWRTEWQESGDPAAKQNLITYNSEDCQALETLMTALIELGQGSPRTGNPSLGEIVNTAKLKREHPYGFKRNTFALPELNTINDAAYWDYQRERVYVKSNVKVKHALSRRKTPRIVLPPNKIIECPRPRNCPRCGSRKFVKHTKYTKILYDLRFMRHGIKRWIVRYRFHRYQCTNCQTVFQPEETFYGKGKFGREIIAYSVYLSIELRLPQLHVASKLNRLFGFHLSSASIGDFKAKAAENYVGSYNALVKRLCSGRLLHADETKINVKDKDGFVWVFANMEEVAYVFSETREADLIQTVLRDFKGVLVSDFYPAYDSIQCPQQKCLIHLIRDLNDDLLKHPYDEELKQVAQMFTLLLKPMIETVDRHGLKTRFLRKHLEAVDGFYGRIADLTLQSETAVKFSKRLDKNHDKLFTFLSFDGIPWNNNNAEHAVKAFAALRRIIGGVTTEKGLRDYLVLLSLCETCKYMGVDFLDFLRSGEKDIRVFAENRRGRRPGTQTNGQKALPADGGG